MQDRAADSNTRPLHPIKHKMTKETFNSHPQSEKRTQMPDKIVKFLSTSSDDGSRLQHFSWRRFDLFLGLIFASDALPSHILCIQLPAHFYDALKVPNFVLVCTFFCGSPGPPLYVHGTCRSRRTADYMSFFSFFGCLCPLSLLFFFYLSIFFWAEKRLVVMAVVNGRRCG